ncbi:unnamed protein product [Zymoseptoria tritici ST99CH_1A5]|uniref:Uncharacterized protein n=2 Tax=Zymoseptoria tritici TaxID=1047171 RepID=A0A1X7RQE1_ZYMT9|nr:unnamed protein product [Zymoseptoria tritici ST99CH_3D7]SMY23356.1 unnamed protein product [Zymoseptoria tritici ST99CH_1A5]
MPDTDAHATDEGSEALEEIQETFVIESMTYEKLQAAKPLINALIERDVLGYRWESESAQLTITLYRPGPSAGQ